MSEGLEDLRELARGLANHADNARRLGDEGLDAGVSPTDALLAAICGTQAAVGAALMRGLVAVCERLEEKD